MFNTNRSQGTNRLRRIETLEKRELHAADFMMAPALGAPVATLETDVVQVTSLAGVESELLSEQGVVAESKQGRQPDKDGKGCTQHDWPSMPRPNVGVSNGHRPLVAYSPEGREGESDRDRSADDVRGRQNTIAIAAIDAALVQTYGHEPATQCTWTWTGF